MSITCVCVCMRAFNPKITSNYKENKFRINVYAHARNILEKYLSFQKIYEIIAENNELHELLKHHIIIIENDCVECI